jgi:hypothetical protein
LAWVVRPLGISLESDKVVIGKDGWLFLGDEYAESISYKREGALKSHLEEGKRISEAAALWDDWLQQNGVKSFKILLCPDKSTIYPELLPDWALPKEPSRTDFLLKLNPTQIIFPKQDLLGVKSVSADPVYFKTDSHWNSLGAWSGYHALANSLRLSSPELKWLTDSDIAFKTEIKSRGSDLVRLLGLGDREFIAEPDVIIRGSPEIDFLEKDFENETEWHSRTESMLKIDINEKRLMQFPSALNESRLLWIRDSSGNSLFPFIGATFSEVLQIHPGQILHKPEEVKNLVYKYKPDYLVISVVERNFTALKFSN